MLVCVVGERERDREHNRTSAVKLSSKKKKSGRNGCKKWDGINSDSNIVVDSGGMTLK